VRQHRGWYALGVICLLATNALTVKIPELVGVAVDELANGSTAPLGGQLLHVRELALVIALCGVAIIVVRTLSRTLFFNPGRTVEYDLKNDMFRRLLGLPQSFFDVMQPGEILSRGTNDASSVRALAGFGTLQLFNVTLLLAFTLIQMVRIDPMLTLVCSLPLVLAALILRIGIRAMFFYIVRIQAQAATLSERILESYNSAAMLQAHSAVPGATVIYREASEGIYDLAIGVERIRAWLLPLVQVVGSLCIVLLLTYGGQRLAAQAVTIGEIAAFSVYIGILGTGLTSLGWLVNSVQRGWVALTRVNEILEAHDPRRQVEAELEPAGTEGYGLEVRDLTFQHPSASHPAVQGISLSITPGETVGIFGLTGCGKTTLLNIIARVYDPPPGTVFVGGTDILDVQPASLWRRLAYVTQRPFLFSESIRANILLGSGDSGEGLDRAIDDAALTSELEAFPSGIDTVIGERGITLSGGQRQRVALARAFYRDFDLLLLDDVLSAVDHATETRLIEAIYRRLEAREGTRSTALIVSHRVSVLAQADRVLVLDGGRIVDEGHHDQLITRDSGVYRRAWILQQAEGEGNDV
jgi:ATP-binding cassette subfamily B multidrug efflux pump